MEHASLIRFFIFVSLIHVAWWNHRGDVRLSGLHSQFLAHDVIPYIAMQYSLRRVPAEATEPSSTFSITIRIATEASKPWFTSPLSLFTSCSAQLVCSHSVPGRGPAAKALTKRVCTELVQRKPLLLL